MTIKLPDQVDWTIPAKEEEKKPELEIKPEASKPNIDVAELRRRIEERMRDDDYRRRLEEAQRDARSREAFEKFHQMERKFQELEAQKRALEDYAKMMKDKERREKALQDLGLTQEALSKLQQRFEKK